MGPDEVRHVTTSADALAPAETKMPDKVKQQAMPTDGDPTQDAAGALQGGEAHRGNQEAAPLPLGRKDPTITGDNAPDKENVQIRPNSRPGV